MKKMTNMAFAFGSSRKSKKFDEKVAKKQVEADERKAKGGICAMNIGSGGSGGVGMYIDSGAVKSSHTHPAMEYNNSVVINTYTDDVVSDASNTTAPNVASRKILDEIDMVQREYVNAKSVSVEPTLSNNSLANSWINVETEYDADFEKQKQHWDCSCATDRGRLSHHMSVYKCPMCEDINPEAHISRDKEGRPALAGKADYFEFAEKTAAIYTDKTDELDLELSKITGVAKATRPTTSKEKGSGLRGECKASSASCRISRGFSRQIHLHNQNEDDD